MAANRRKTIEYAFATRITPLATNTTLATATRHDTAQITLFIPELTSRNFLSVRLVMTYRTEYAASNFPNGWRMGIQLGGAATSDNDRTFTVGNTGGTNTFDVGDLDVTSYFNANFGTAGSQTCVASLAVATATATTINGITCKLVITYEFDSAPQATRVKTIRIPIQSQAGALTAAQQEIGTDGTTGAPINQIPLLDTFLPEASKVYRQMFLELCGNDANPVSTTTPFTPFVQLDTAAETARATINQTLATALPWRDIVDVTSTLAPGAAHALKLRCDVAARMTFASSTLVVTYEYNASTTNSIMCEALIPLTMSNDDSFGIAQGESFTTVQGDAQALIAAFSIQETNPVIAQSAVYLNCMSYGSATVVSVRAGAQASRGYNTGASGNGVLGDAPIVHRVDHSSGWTVARGDNRLALNVFNSQTLRADVTGYALINYRATPPSDVDAATHVVNYFAAAYGPPSVTIDVAALGGGLRVPVLGTPYRLQGVMVEQYYHVIGGNLFNQLLLEQRAGEWDAAGFIATPYRHGAVTLFGSWRVTWPLTKAFNLDHLHVGKLNIETARRQIAFNGNQSSQASWSWWITYHQLSFTVAGVVTIGGVPAATGKPVQIYARDGSNNVELVATATTGANGAFAVAVVDNTRTYFASYQDGSSLGRSGDGTPSSSSFNVAIPAGVATTLAAASDVRGRILSSGVVELSWAYPDNIATQNITFDVYQSTDPTDAFRSAAATAVGALVVQLAGAPLIGDRYFSVVARRGLAQALPSKAAFVAVPGPVVVAVPATASPARDPAATGVGFPFGITPSGSVFAQGGDALLRGKILQLLLTAPGERVNRPAYGTRLIDLVFDPNSDVLAATMEFTITRALQQQFADDIQLDTVQLTTSDDTLLVDISYLRKADLRLEQVRIGVPLPPGAAP